MTDNTTWLLQHPYRQFVLGIKAAWEDDLSPEAFNQLFNPACVCHMQGHELHNAEEFQQFIQSIRLNIAQLRLIPESVIVEDDRVYLVHRWQAENWHPGVIAGGTYSNFCQVVIRISKGRIVELWQPVQNFLFLLGYPLSGDPLPFPAWSNNLLMREHGQLIVASDERSAQMAERAKKLVDCAFGNGALRQIDRLLHPELVFYNGETRGQGIAEWKSFIYALRTAIGEEGLERCDELCIRERHSLTLFVRLGLKQDPAFVLPGANGMLCVLKLEMDNRFITQIKTYPENYIFFLGLDFSQHLARLQQLFRGERQPLAIPSWREHLAGSKASSSLPPVQDEQVAVVGIAGRFPQADSVALFWQNLLEGKTAFSAFEPQRSWLSNGTVIQHAGLVNHVFRFDEQYFQLSPLAAQYMDPQHRLWLETIVQSIEDSGHPHQDMGGERTALFISSLSNDYEKLLRDLAVQENFHYWAGNEPAMALGRVARFLDIQGPTQFINTECTGGITALLAACDLIRTGQVDQAIVSAASLFLHPYGFIIRQDGLLSPAAAPELFSKRSKGQLRGEAVVAVVLKSLSKAQQDGDDIYAILAGGAVNNSGKTFSLIAANVEQQAKVIRKAWLNAGVCAEDISVIECNASGVRAGDFAEVTALKNVFSPEQPVALSTVKGAIGHTEAASGLVALVKVLLQLRHRTITGIQGLSDVDDSLGIAGCGLSLNRQNKIWAPAMRQGQLLPRVAGINSFAGGGYNAHTVVKEFIAQENTPVGYRGASLLIPLSAYSEASLHQHVLQLKQYLQQQDVDLVRLAFTLQHREPQQYRVILRVSRMPELLLQLEEILTGAICMHNIKEPQPADALLLAQNTISFTLADRQLAARLAGWLKGEDFSWSTLWEQGTPHRLSGLPVREFQGAVHLPPSSTHKSKITLDTPSQSYLYHFSGNENYLRQHRVDRQNVLPGVVQLELVRQAAMHKLPGSEQQLSLRHVGWLRPARLTASEQGLTLAVTFAPDAGADEGQNLAVGFAITLVDEQGQSATSGPVTTGSVVFSPAHQRPALDIAQCQQHCQQRRLSGERCYEILALLGIEIGEGHQAIENISLGRDDEGNPVALAKLSFAAESPSVYQFAHQSVPFGVCPAIMDGALQAAYLGLLAPDELKSGAQTPIPFAVDDITVIQPLQSEGWAWVKEATSLGAPSSIRKMDIVIGDRNGGVCVVVSGFSTRTMSTHAGSDVASPPQANDIASPQLTDQSLIIGQLKEILAKELGILPTRLRTNEPLDKYGIDSATAIQLIAALEKTFGSLPKTLFYEHKRIADIARYLAQSAAASAGVAPKLAESSDPLPATLPPTPLDSRLNIAIIGMSAKYPQSEDVTQIWHNLKQGKRCISEIPASRWEWQRYYQASQQSASPGAHASKWGGFINGVDEFDFAFFAMTEQEAATLDPQERIFLQQAWKAIEDAGYTPETLVSVPGAIGAVGVYAGSMYSEYQLHDMQTGEQQRPIGLVGSQASIANRVSYYMDFHGPSITVDAMCTSSMVAIEQACQDLKRGRIHAAIVGGVNLTLHPNKYLTLSRRKMLSSDPHLNSFGTGSNGYIPGEGVGVLVLKRLDDALAEGAHIYGVIQGCAINQNGRSNGFGAPDPQAQQAVIEQAMLEAGAKADDISYIEAHSTGTRYGDLIEVSALTQAFRHRSADNQAACLMGSGKSNFGHCEAAAGVGSVIKVLLQIQHRAIAPTLYGEMLNPAIDFEQTPFRVNSALTDWEVPDGEKRDQPRVAGISCFGAGGTNAHLILTEFCQPEPLQAGSQSPCLVLLSAKTPDGLRRQVQQLQAYLSPYQHKDALHDQGGEPLLERLAFTLQVGREHMPIRAGFLAESVADLCRQLALFVDGADILSDSNDAEQFAELPWQERINTWLGEQNGHELLNVWLRGADVDWQRGYRHRQPQRLGGLPTYPFAPCKIELKAAEAATLLPAAVHPSPLSRDQGFAFLADPTLVFRQKAQRFVSRALENIIDSEIPSLNMSFSALQLTSLNVVRFLDFWQVVFGQSLQFVIFYQQRNVQTFIDYLIEHQLLTPEGLLVAADLLAQPVVEGTQQSFPLTELQESFVIGRELSTYGQCVGSTLYFELDITQAITIANIESAWAHLVDYHEALHMVVNDALEQELLVDYPRYRIPVIDLSAHSATEAVDYLASSRASLNCQVFDLARWPYFDIRAFTLDAERVVLQIALDEVIADAASVFMLIDQWRNLSTNPHYKLPVSSYSLRQHLTLLADIRSGEHFQQSMGYWLDKLADMPSGPRLDYDAMQSPQQQSVHCLTADIDSEWWLAIKTQASELSCSPGAVLLCVFCEVLHQFTAQERFSLNLTNLNRLAINQQVNGLVGLLANSNIFVSAWDPQQSFQSRVVACQQQLDLDASHSFVGAVNVLRRLRQDPLKRAEMSLPVVFTNLLSAVFQPSGCQEGWSVQHMMNTTPQVALDHHVFEDNGRLVYRWYIANALLDQGSVVTLFEAYRQKLIARAQTVAHWQRPVGANSESERAFPLLGIQKALYAGHLMPSVLGGKDCICHLEFDIDRLDVDQLTAAWNYIVAYHPVLRTCNLASLQQAVLSKVPHYIIPTETLLGTEEEFDQRCDKIRHDLLVTRYYADEYPGYRLRVCALNQQKSRLFINFNFILIDGRSIFFIINQLFAKYRSPGYRPQLQDITFQDVVRDYGRQRKALPGSSMEGYWHNKFSQMTQDLAEITESARRASLPATLSQQLPYYRQLQVIANRLNVSIDSILLAAFGRTLFNWHQATTGRNKPITLAVVNWDRGADLPDTTTGVFTRLGWVSFTDAIAAPARDILHIQAQLDEDQRHSAVDELEVAQHYPHLHFPVVYTCLLTQGTDFPEPTYSVSQTPGVALDNISTVINSASVRIQWDTLASCRNEFSTLFQQYCLCLEQWINDSELLNFEQQ